jgi:hypothetical protein
VAVGAQKRTSGFCGLPAIRTGEILLASPDRIREKPALAYDGTSESLVAAKQSLSNLPAGRREAGQRSEFL